MMPSGASATLLGTFVGSIIALGPRVFDKLTGRKREAAEGASVISTGAGAVTTAALALLEQHREDADQARQAEERARQAEELCQMRLAGVSARCGALEVRVRELAALHDDGSLSD